MMVMMMITMIVEKIIIILFFVYTCSVGTDNNAFLALVYLYSALICCLMGYHISRVYYFVLCKRSLLLNK